MELGTALSNFADKAANAVIDIGAESTDAGKKKKFLLLLLLQKQFGAEVSPLLWLLLRDSVAKFHSKLLEHLPDALQSDATLDEQAQTKIVQDAHTEAKKYLLILLTSIQSLGGALRFGRDTIIRRLTGSPKVGQIKTDSQAREALAKKIIRVRGSDGMDRSYHPEHYGNLIQDNAEGKAAAATAITMSEQIGSDLVEMSPATHKDWCDLFASQIYSVSGEDPRVYPLEILPGGAVPLHPFCVHTLRPVAPDTYTDQQLRARSTLPREFVELGMKGNASASDFTKLWLQKSPAEWGL